MSKKYYEYMSEISSEELLKGLLEYGLFADKLPPIFSCESFYAYCKKRKFEGFSKNPTDYIRYNSTRNTNIPRLLSIPTPFSYMYQCKCIYDNWNKICNLFQEKTSNQSYKYSQIHIQKLKHKNFLFEMSHSYCDKDSLLDVELSKLSILKRFKVEADISSCFPSIYTHSLSWALVGKDEAKKNKSNVNIWYNELDTTCRNTKNGETNGLLIGPHASNLLSEIILCNIDNELVKKGYKYIRNIDDFCCFVKSEEEAECFLLDLSEELKKFELNINTKKTKILKLPLPSDIDWIRALNEFIKGDTYTENRKLIFKYQRLKLYLDLAIKLAMETNNCAVFTYAIKIIANCHLGKKAKYYYINTLHQLICFYPYLVHWMENFVFDIFDISQESISLIAHDLYDIGIKRHIYEACSFSIYWSLKYDFKLNKMMEEDSIRTEDSLFMLLSFLKVKKDRNKDAKKLLKEHARSLLNDIDRYWLFLYEALPKDDLTGDYKCLKNNRISFVKPEFK